jgi:hypothetical protein
MDILIIMKPLKNNKTCYNRYKKASVEMLNYTYLEGGCKMATSSFNKDYTLDSAKAVDSFAKIVATPAKSVKINRSLTSPAKEKQGEEKLKRILSR